MMKKCLLDFRVVENVRINSNYGLLKLCVVYGTMPQLDGGQVVEIEVPDSKSTFLRRPISVCNVDGGLLWLLIRNAGEGTRHLINLPVNSVVNLMLPLGNGYSRPADKERLTLLVGGGVGVAPLLYFGKFLRAEGFNIAFLLAAKTKNDLLLLDEFRKVAKVYVSTDDGSMGEKGLITKNSILESSEISHISCCGPLPMMKGVAAIARDRGITCEVSLENVMACGLGACLCCVEDTADKGNVCVCKDGPVFNINRLKW